MIGWGRRMETSFVLGLSCRVLQYHQCCLGYFDAFKYPIRAYYGILANLGRFFRLAIEKAIVKFSILGVSRLALTDFSDSS